MSELKRKSSRIVYASGEKGLNINLKGNIGDVLFSGIMGASLTSTVVTTLSYQSLTALTVGVGTTIANIPFPESVTVSLSNGQTKPFGILSWSEVGTYNSSQVGLYTFEAVVNFPETYINTLTVTISVLVVHLKVSGGTVTTVGDYKVHTFNSDGNFVIDYVNTAYAGTLEVLVVGGGGGSSGTFSSGGGSGGGGGGQVISSSFAYSALSAGTFPAVIGNGGSGSTAPTQASNGGNSTFMGITAGGGGYGARGYNGGTGANGGGAGGSSISRIGGTGSSGKKGGDNGINAYASGQTGGGGSSSANNGTKGADGSPTGGGAGGLGVSSSITGTAKYYGNGGRGGDANTSPVAVASNTGHGAQGARAGVTMNGLSGASGVVIVRYKFQNF